MDLTIVIQGPLNPETLERYIHDYAGYPIVISTWMCYQDMLSNYHLPANFKVLLQQQRDPVQRLHDPSRQQISTREGLRLVQTRFAIKLRGDEFYSSIDTVHEELIMQPGKLHCMPVFFRYSWDLPYHCSDHFVAGEVGNMNLMFGNLWHETLSRDICKAFWSSEQKLTLSYLSQLYPDEHWLIESKTKSHMYMRKHFNILDHRKHVPYQVSWNHNKLRNHWNRLPHDNRSNLICIDDDRPIRGAVTG